jgi:hypothetical protein
MVMGSQMEVKNAQSLHRPVVSTTGARPALVVHPGLKIEAKGVAQGDRAARLQGGSAVDPPSPHREPLFEQTGVIQ